MNAIESAPNLGLAKHSLHCMHSTWTHMHTPILYTWTHHRAHPLALSQHVILMMRCGMPHYRHTQPCSCSTIDGPGAYFNSLDPPGVMLRHKYQQTTQRNKTHIQKHNTGFPDKSLRPQADTHSTHKHNTHKNKITSECQSIGKPLFLYPCAEH